MAHYKKGANAERELLHLLFERGFACIRVAGSGATILPAPDIIALNRKKKLAIECKAWKASHLSIPLQQMEELLKFGQISGLEVIIAWKIPNKGWHFLKPGMFKKAGKNYMISQKQALKKAQSLDLLTGIQAQLP